MYVRAAITKEDDGHRNSIVKELPWAFPPTTQSSLKRAEEGSRVALFDYSACEYSWTVVFRS